MTSSTTRTLTAHLDFLLDLLALMGVVVGFIIVGFATAGAFVNAVAGQWTLAAQAFAVSLAGWALLAGCAALIAHREQKGEVKP